MRYPLAYLGFARLLGLYRIRPAPPPPGARKPDFVSGHRSAKVIDVATASSNAGRWSNDIGV